MRLFVWIDPEAPQERPHVASPPAAGPETLPALPAAYQQMLQVSVNEGVRQALQALSLKQNHGPQPLATRPHDRQVEDFVLVEESEGEDTER